MPPVTITITMTSTDVPVETIRALHTELAAVGLPVVGAEVDGTPRFGAGTQARVREFQKRYGLRDTGDVDAGTSGVMSLSALVATESDRSQLRAKLKNALNDVPDSPEYNYWLARYEILVGDYATAKIALSRLRGFRDVGDLNTIIDPSQPPGSGLPDSGVVTDGGGGQPPQAPEVPFPENFYSYRKSLISQEAINVRTTRTIPSGTTRPGRLADSAAAWLTAVESWQLGNAEFERQSYDSAAAAYDRCQQATLDYFAIYPDYNLQYTTNTLAARIDELVVHIASDRLTWADLWQYINWRLQLLSLVELQQQDWVPQIIPGNIVYQLLQGNFTDPTGSDQPPPPTNPIGPAQRRILMDARLVVIAAVLAPLARGEANRARRHYAAAREDFSRVLRKIIPTSGGGILPFYLPLACEFIEAPFARLLLIETMIGQAEAQYKARLSVDDEQDQTARAQQLAKLAEIAQDFNSRHIPGDAVGNATKPFQHLVAAFTYNSALDAIGEDGEYLARAKLALDTLQAAVTSTVAGGDVSSMAFRSIGQTVTVPTVSSIGSALPGLTAGTHPHEPYLQFRNLDGQPMRERNPRVYALLLQAQARLLQIWNGFNYLGYRDDYVPPWRFQYLLDRARYFSEHAKNAQRDYLNFLSNGGNEELKEISAAQSVTLEKANVQIDTARVEQATKEVAATQDGANLAALHAQNAAEAAQEYADFKDKADEADAKSLIGSILGGELKLATGYGAAEGGLDLFNTLWGGAAHFDAAAAQRNFEKHNLERPAAEALVAANEARARLAVAQAALVVAALQRQAALLRHEFALQNLQFLQNQTLNAEQWYRMAGAIRAVGDTYLRYAIEMAFLAQQAYNFEADKRFNGIRFDYDASAVGAMLAADFLLRDLDSFEQDLIVSQQTRQQQVRYVLSMAREFPETLKKLADTGEVMFSMRLEQLERHFPGLLDLRISSVDVQPVALMDPARVSVQLTHLGTGMIRLKAQPGESPLNTTDLAPNGDWLSTAGADWPVKVHVSGPQSAVFSGLSRQEAASLGMIAASERAAFEGVPGASNWRIDMSMKENQVVPGTLTDVLITFVLTGFYDAGLNQTVDDAVASARQPFATTSFVSARRALPDAYYSLVHYGKLDWTVSERMLSLAGTPNELQNLAAVLPLVQNGVELGRCYCRYPIRLPKLSPGPVEPLTILPQFTMTSTGLTLHCAFTGPAGTDVTWDFGDNAPLAQGITAQHVYARAWRYEVVARLAKDGKLVEYRSTVVVSANHPIPAPLIVTPAFSASAIAADGTVALTVSVPPAVTDVSVDCSAGTVRGWSDTGSVTLRLKPSFEYVLDFLATRKLSARLYSKQRYLPTVPVALSRGRASTNRTFDPSTRVTTTTSPNAFTKHLFANGNVTISPVDRWTLELPVAENPCFMSVSPSDVAEFDGGELSDAVLSLEFLGSQ